MNCWLINCCELIYCSVGFTKAQNNYTIILFYYTIIVFAFIFHLIQKHLLTTIQKKGPAYELFDKIKKNKRNNIFVFMNSRLM